MSEDSSSQRDQPPQKRSSVRELILRAERQSRTSSKGSLAPSVPVAPVQSHSAVRKLSKSKTFLKKTMQPSGGKRKKLDNEVRLEHFKEGTLQHKLPHSLQIHNRRQKAKQDYLKEQKRLQVEYETQLRKLHEAFTAAEEDIVSLFPTKLTSPQAAKQKVIDKLREDIKNEKDDKQKEKLEKEVGILIEELKELKTDSEKEFECLDKLWLSINAITWDILLSNPNFNNFFGRGGRHASQDVFENIRRGDDSDIAKAIGENNKNHGRKIQAGHATYWALNQIACDENSLKAVSAKLKNRIHTVARSAVKIAGVEDNKVNREKASAVLKKEGWKELRKAVESFAVEMNENILHKLLMEESKLERKVIVRIDGVDRTSETVRVVMVLDRNMRPCVGGIAPPPAPVVEQPTVTVPQIAEPADEEQVDAEVAVGTEAEIAVTEGSESYGSGSDDEESEDEEEEEQEEETANTENVSENNDTGENDENHIEGYRTTEQGTRPREYHIPLAELVCFQGIDIVEESLQVFYTGRFEDSIPHITYQRVAGFQRINNNLNEDNGNRRRRDVHDDAGDFAIIDLGIRLNKDPLDPFDEYEQDWRNGTLYNLRHKKDGPIRFVGFNETGFGFVEQRPIDMQVQKILDSEGKVKGVNILHMTLYDINEQVCFDTLYLKDEDDMATNTTWKTFGKDAIGNRLAYRIVAQHGKISAVLYPFQGCVKHADLNVKDVSNLQEGTWINIKVEGQMTRRLARVKLIPTGMVLGQIDAERRSQSVPTPFLEMIRERQRAFAEMPGLVDVEIFCEDDQLLTEPRTESWPIECCFEASNDDMAFLRSLENEKEEVEKEVTKGVVSVVEDVEAFVGDRTKRANHEAFLQEATALKKLLEEQKGVVPETNQDLMKAVEGALASLDKTTSAVKRAANFRKSKKNVQLEKENGV